MWRDLFRFLFKGDFGNVIHVRQVRIRKGIGEIEQDPSQVNRADKIYFIKLFSWVLSIILIICVTSTILLAVLERKIPDFLPQTITGILGYFGGAISVYFGIRSSP
jgi:hypothetical protein